MKKTGMEVLLLGCTHYPYLKPLIEEAAGGGVQVIDSAGGVARHTANVLSARHILHPPTRPGTLTVYTSADADEVRPLVWRLVGEEVEVITSDAKRDE